MTPRRGRARPGRRGRAATLLAAAGTTCALLLSGCSSYGVEPGADGETGTVTYWMWEAAQLPAYQQCAADFQAINPDIDIKIEQFGWDDYWNKLFTGFVANSAPDVFADHTSRYGEFADRGLIEPIDEQVEEAGIDLVHWAELPAGGHFPAIEVPDLLVAELRGFLRRVG